MRYAYIFLLVLVLVLVAGCSRSTPTGQVTTDVGGDEVSTVVQTDEGVTKITSKGGSDGWCQEGAEWTMNSAADGANAQWTIDRLENTGEYAGYCHVVYSAESPDGDIRMDYYFDETGENGYYEMDVGGQKIKQEWHG